MTDPLPAAEPYVLSILVMPAQANTLGVMHGGHMMSWMDMAAWVVATRAVEAGQTVYFKAVHDCVWSGPIHAGEVCHVDRAARRGRDLLAARCGSTARAEDPVAKETREVCRAVFTMVAAEDGVAVPVRLHARRRLGRGAAADRRSVRAAARSGP